jgi:allantoate deiminase
LSAPHNLREQAETIIARCRELAQFTEEPGQIKRTFLSPAMRACMQTVQGWMESAGMTVTTDNAGNLRGRYLSGPRLLIGSHLDTVPNAGAFDGLLGVMMGLALVEQKPPCAIELIGFSEEEGVRFKLPFIGSKALVGRLGAASLATKDAHGVSVEQALRSFGLKPNLISECAIDKDALAFLEFHIEQGIVLESEDQSLGVVEAIAGQTRAEFTFTGKARHAGTTPMHLRNDAVAGAAEWVVEVERAALSTQGLVATVGDLRTHPGAGNVIAGQARASLDVRHAQDAIRHQAVSHLLTQADAIARRRGLTVTSTLQMDQPAVAMDAGLSSRATGAIRSLGIEPLPMVSGAGHDAMILAEHIPTAMIFLRSPGGISHHPDETVRVQDVEHAVAAGLAFVEQFARSQEKSTPHV